MRVKRWKVFYAGTIKGERNYSSSTSTKSLYTVLLSLLVLFVGLRGRRIEGLAKGGIDLSALRF